MDSMDEFQTILFQLSVWSVVIIIIYLLIIPVYYSLVYDGVYQQRNSIGEIL